MAATRPSPSLGPGEFFRDHRGLYGLSLASALGAAGYAVVESRKAEPGRAVGWWALAGLTGAQAVGMTVSRLRARPSDDGRARPPRDV
jgi:hypothetical protein